MIKINFKKLKDNKGFVILYAVTIAAILLSIAIGVADGTGGARIISIHAGADAVLNRVFNISRRDVAQKIRRHRADGGGHVAEIGAETRARQGVLTSVAGVGRRADLKRGKCDRSCFQLRCHDRRRHGRDLAKAGQRRDGAEP